MALLKYPLLLTTVSNSAMHGKKKLIPQPHHLALQWSLLFCLSNKNKPSVWGEKKSSEFYVSYRAEQLIPATLKPANRNADEK